MNEIEKAVVPKVLIQTSPSPVPQYVVDMVMKHCPGWEYKHFDDEDIFRFFDENPLEEFKDIKQRFESFSHGAHRADLFRYFYLYQKGGVYLDSDAVLNLNIEEIYNGYDFVSINSYHHNKTLIFNGFLVAKPGCPVMYDALKDAYEMDDKYLNDDYHLLCKNLATIVARHMGENIKIYQEERSKDFHAGVRAYTDDRKLFLTHYCYLRKIPSFRNRFVSMWYPLIFRVKLLKNIYRTIQKHW